MRRFRELKAQNNEISYQDVLKSIKKRDKSDIKRKISPLKKTSDSILLNTSNLSIRRCFLKIKKSIDKKIFTEWKFIKILTILLHKNSKNY